MIHPTAIIDLSARLAEDCKVGPYCVIGADVEIGSGCEMKSHVVVNGPTRIDKNNLFYSFCSVGDAPQDLKYHGEPTELVIGNDNTFREYVTLNRGTVGGSGITRIGDNNLLMAYTHVAHDCDLGNHIIMSNAASLAGHVVLEDHVILGAFTTVHQFTRIGKYAFSGLSTTISRDIPPYIMAAGSPARPVGINKTGLQRHNFEREVIDGLHRAFRTLVKSKSSRQAALQTLEQLQDDVKEVKYFIDFIINSERGITR